MKTLLGINIFLLCALLSTQAQDNPVTLKAYRTWVIPAEKGRVAQGVFYAATDSSVMISNSVLKNDYLSGNFSFTEIPVKDIKTLQFRKKGDLGTAVLIGSLSGALVGTIIGVMQNTKDGSAVEQNIRKGVVVMFPVVLTCVGATIGLTAGGAKKKFNIRGNQEAFDIQKKELEGFSIKYCLDNEKTAGIAFSKLRETVTDYDGNVYHTLALGGQVWMEEDLKALHFRDGSSIPGTENDLPARDIRYNWMSVNDSRKLCPAGWHVPSEKEWQSLFQSLGSENWAAIKLEGAFSGKKKAGHWWSSTETEAEKSRSFYYDSRTVGVMFTDTDKNSALPVKCLRDF